MEDESITKINLTSLVDISLVLVIIFMVIAPFMAQRAIDIASSKMNESKGKVAQAQNVTVTLNDKGEIGVNGKTVTWGELPGELSGAIKRSKDKMVMLQASSNNQVKYIVDILDCARQRGALKLAILKRK
ncbi:MAG: biopolymer transporter ExbD [Elusimicrobia bacterium]|nr:biopolymer transporter ExbD [Candidatus Liberimonas magnetica]